ncbi:hypothetical protein [Methanoregula sp.]|jgi:hypothetical protein|uniref:hypothetical protein n=1 Tax=Methanoregula sp. TaxID=2052170 RepID=UPI003569E7F9
MKVFPVGVVTVTLIIAAILFTGCTGSAPSSPTTTPQVTVTVTQPAVTPAITTVRQPSATIIPDATTSPPAAITIFGEYKWAEYRNNITQTLAPNPRFQWDISTRIERSYESYKGIPALHEKIIQTFDYAEWVDHQLVTTKNGTVCITDRFFNVSSDEILGGTVTETIKGVAQPGEKISADDNYRRDDSPTSVTGIMPFGEMNITLTDQGTESVTVPAGPYPNARKYIGDFRDGTPITFWIVPGIPVPVQFRFPNKNLDGENPIQSFELKGWG